MPAYNQGDPMQKIQYCDECFNPTGRCEEDTITDEHDQTLCEECYLESLKLMKDATGEKNDTTNQL